MPHPIDFLSPKDITLHIESHESMDTVCNRMEDRFIGLPHFHKSIDLRMVGHKKITDRHDERSICQVIKNQTAPHLHHNLKSMLLFISQQKGKKSFGLLHLKIGLVPALLDKMLDGKYKNRWKKRLLLAAGVHFSVPVTLALASVTTYEKYLSLAIGIKGVSHYSSTLQLEEGGSENRYMIKAGMNVSIYPSHIDRLIPQKIAFMVNDKDLLNKYLESHLIPEKKQIVAKLCNYVFNRCHVAAGKPGITSLNPVATG